MTILFLNSQLYIILIVKTEYKEIESISLFRSDQNCEQL